MESGTRLTATQGYDKKLWNNPRQNKTYSINTAPIGTLRTGGIVIDDFVRRNYIEPSQNPDTVRAQEFTNRAIALRQQSIKNDLEMKEQADILTQEIIAKFSHGGEVDFSDPKFKKFLDKEVAKKYLKDNVALMLEQYKGDHLPYETKAVSVPAYQKQPDIQDRARALTLESVQGSNVPPSEEQPEPVQLPFEQPQRVLTFTPPRPPTQIPTATVETRAAVEAIAKELGIPLKSNREVNGIFRSRPKQLHQLRGEINTAHKMQRRQEDQGDGEGK